MSDVLFGREKVTYEEKSEKVTEVFDNVATVYDKMNDAMSLGTHRLWKQQAVAALNCHPNDIIADLSCGTGDISEQVLKRIPYGKLLCIDPNSAMLKICKKRLISDNVSFIESTAESLRLEEPLDKLIVSFGLRNFANESLGLESIFKSLKTGGKVVIMEFNPPGSSNFSQPYEMYLKYVIPYLGKLIGHSEESYQYLSDSIIVQPTPEERVEQLKSIGFEFIRYTPLTFGCVGLWEAYRCKE